MGTNCMWLLAYNFLSGRENHFLKCSWLPIGEEREKSRENRVEARPLGIYLFFFFNLFKIARKEKQNETNDSKCVTTW